MARPKHEEWLQQGWARSDRMLRRVYNEFGPKHTPNGKFAVFPSRKFAKLTRKQAKEKWNFYGVELMHRVAQVLEAD